MNILELIKTRKSVRTFDGQPLAEKDKQALIDYVATIQNPCGIAVDFVFLDAEEHGLSSQVINGEHLYVAGKVAKVPDRELAFGYSFEKLVLYAWSLGVGTTWIGGTMDRPLFEREAETGDGEIMPIVSPQPNAPRWTGSCGRVSMGMSGTIPQNCSSRRISPRR